jgi:hypothetical protein
MTGPRMNNQAGRLVDDDQVIVFKEDAKRHRLRREPAGHHLGQVPTEPVSRAHPAAGARRSIVVPDMALRDQPLDLAAAEVRKPFGQVMVET